MDAIRRGEARQASRIREFEGRRYHQTILFIEEKDRIRIYGTDITGQ